MHAPVDITMGRILSSAFLVLLLFHAETAAAYGVVEYTPLRSALACAGSRQQAQHKMPADDERLYSCSTHAGCLLTAGF
ncbi:hypothetical protein C8R43DRAFT_598787 [Mycena crocata]|nr:hypothetical protein C8R43DRAFT_598787 [Mycena crocata]